MSRNNDTPETKNLPSGHLLGQVTALAEIRIRTGNCTAEEAKAWVNSVTAKPPVEGQLAVDNMLAYLAIQNG